MKKSKQRCWNCKHVRVEGEKQDALGGTMYYVCGRSNRSIDNTNGLYCQKWESNKPKEEK